MPSQQPTIVKTVHLPLEKLDKCHQCNKTTGLRLCSSCAEQIYCSPACQKADWPSHKAKCGKTDRLDVASFYPFLACMAEQCHISTHKPIHPSLSHKILNDPDPDAFVVGFPDGSAAKLVLLGDPLDLQQMGSRTWWPTAISDTVRSKLFRRLGRQGYVLPILMSLCLALLSEMYTSDWVPASTSPDGKEHRRIRLRYLTNPIADFGIAHGSADVKNQDKLAFWNIHDGSFSKGQDPDDHYWIYFITVSGEEILLDCSMFTFNMCLMVSAEPYLPILSFAPAFFRDRLIDRNTPNLYQERRRASVLRDRNLHHAIAHSEEGFSHPDVDIVSAFMKRLSGRAMTKKEIDLMVTFTFSNMSILAGSLYREEWKKYPPTPAIAIEGDPGELDPLDDQGDDEEWWKHLRKWNRKYKKGEMSKEALGEAFRKYQRENQ